MKYTISKKLFILSFSFFTFANFGTVEKLKGTVTILPPKNLEAKKLKVGDTVSEGASILTRKKSYIKIKTNSGDIITVGPRSKMLIAIKDRQNTLINLLKGKLRTKVTKKNKDHFFIKTRSAALGVRGTDFTTTYHPKSLRTSLLTFDGEVALSKDMSKLNTNIANNKDNLIKTIKGSLGRSAVSVKKADFTTVGLIEEKPIRPVIINPTQYAYLKLDESLGVERTKKDTKQVRKISKEIKDLINNQKSISSLKNGGLIADQIGVYIPPKKNESISKIGKIDTNGNYVPPKGIKLDPVKVFVPIENENPKAVSEAHELNKSLGPQKQVDAENPMYKRYFDL